MSFFDLCFMWFVAHCVIIVHFDMIDMLGCFVDDLHVLN